MANVTSQWAKTTRPTGDASPYRSSSLAFGRGSQGEIRVSLDIGVDNLGSGDKWEFVRLPADAVIDGMFITVDDLDTDGTPTLTFDLVSDDGSTATTHLDGTAIGKTGGSAAAGANFPRLGGDAEISVYALVDGPAATAAAGKATLVIYLSGK